MNRRSLGYFAWVVTLVLGLMCFAFFLTHLAPGDPARVVLGPNAQESAVITLRKDLGLDRPLTIQFANYFERYFTGNWGQSWSSRRPVMRELGGHLPPTLWIGFFAVFSSSFAAAAFIRKRLFAMAVSMLFLESPLIPFLILK